MPKINSKWVFFLAAFLLFAQGAILLHDVEHPFHEESVACEIFLLAENDSEGGLPSAIGSIDCSSFSLVSQNYSSHRLPKHKTSAYSIRAPPFFMSTYI